MKKKFSIGYIVRYPIHYQTPLLKKIAKEFRLTVYYISDLTLKNFTDKGFGKIKWECNNIDTLSHIFAFKESDSNKISCLKISWKLILKFIISKHDAYLFHGYNNINNIIGIFLLSLLGKKVFFRCESNIEYCREGLVKKIFLKILFMQIHKFLYIGTLNKYYYLSKNITTDKLSYVPYCVDNERFSRIISKNYNACNALRKNMFINPSLPVIIFASKMVEKKEPLLLLMAYKKILDNYGYIANLLYVGDGILKTSLMTFADENLTFGTTHFAGFVNQSTLPLYFELSDVFVLPSSVEPYGLVVNEAMLGSNALVLSDKVGARSDLLQTGVNGYVFEHCSVDSLYSKILLILSNNDKLKLMKQNSKEIIKSFNFDKDITGLLNSFYN